MYVFIQSYSFFLGTWPTYFLSQPFLFISDGSKAEKEPRADGALRQGFRGIWYVLWWKHSNFGNYYKDLLKNMELNLES